MGRVLSFTWLLNWDEEESCTILCFYSRIVERETCTMRREEEREVVGKKKELQEIDFDFFFFVNEIIFHAKLNLNNGIIT